MYYQIHPLGDSAITVSFADRIDKNTSEKVLAVFHHLRRRKTDFIKDVIPAYNSLTIVYDIIKARENSRTSSFEQARIELQSAIEEISIEYPQTSQLHEVPVCYGSSFGEDLGALALQKQKSADEIIQLHTSVVYRVYMIGFLPGFAYMGTIPKEIAAPRKTIPNSKVLAGSVGIADTQTGIYPFDSPGGWNIIGRTPLKIFDATETSPCLFNPGDEVRFVPITEREFYEMNRHR